jgi:arsenate reductase (thioredoxin)
MAEGLLRARYGDRYEAFSAGTEPRGVNPLAARAMAEIGIDLSGHRSESIEVYAGRQMDYVVTVCDSARESCPYFPAQKEIIHRSFPDPSAATGTDEEKIEIFRRVRDAISGWIDERFDERR